jgi:hypothetical protein
VTIKLGDDQSAVVLHLLALFTIRFVESPVSGRTLEAPSFSKRPKYRALQMSVGRTVVSLQARLMQHPRSGSARKPNERVVGVQRMRGCYWTGMGEFGPILTRLP